ncbi:MAG: hypothetical protein ACLP50_05900, partial [Solirubrobacteraceae bacterium]
MSAAARKVMAPLWAVPERPGVRVLEEPLDARAPERRAEARRPDRTFTPPDVADQLGAHRPETLLCCSFAGGSVTALALQGDALARWYRQRERAQARAARRDE